MIQEHEITYKGITLLVGGTYYKGEEMVRYNSDLSGVPESPSTFDINEVFVEETDIYELFSSEQLQDIEKIILELIEEC